MSDLIEHLRHADEEELWLMRPALVKRIEELEAENERLREAIRWALGEVDDFTCQLTGKEGPYWWRTELRQRAGLIYNRETSRSEVFASARENDDE